MKDNLYTKTMENIKAPQKLVDNTIEQMREAGENSTVITFEKPKRRVLKFVSAVAAVLALIIGLSVIPFGDGISTPDNEHNFVLKVGAAEITPDVYIEVGELSNSGSGASFRPKDQETALESFDWCGEYDLIRMDKMFLPQVFDVQGDNIESITYTTHNCRLAYDSKFEGIVDVEEIPIEEMKEKGTAHFYNSYKWAKSCTLDYQSQRTSVDSGEWFAMPKFGVEFAFEYEIGEYTIIVNEKNDVDIEPFFVEEFNAHADEFTLDITANFNDGESVTKTLKFRCENPESSVMVLYAKEVQ
ncbi:MAG: hypothetical protein IJ331_08735, partial [Ruminococcus sp.]|nr:hypothetical protein [Ruminococcus sp.]